MSKKLLVFLSHASQDKHVVRRLCKRLKEDGFNPWLERSLEIEGALGFGKGFGDDL